MRVINLIGGANTGKSTTAFGLMYALKKMGLKVGYAEEYAADMVLEKRQETIMKDQLYMLGKQHRRLDRLRPMCDWVVSDTSLLLALVYARENRLPELDAAIRAYYASFDNVVFYFPRNHALRFQPEFRTQKSHDEAAEMDGQIEAILPPETIRLEKADDYVQPILRHLGFAPQAEVVAPVEFLYTNWRGETELRQVQPQMLRFGSTYYHPQPQWLLNAIDLRKGEVRDFALSGIDQPGQLKIPFGVRCGER